MDFLKKIEDYLSFKILKQRNELNSLIADQEKKQQILDFISELDVKPIDENLIRKFLDFKLLNGGKEKTIQENLIKLLKLEELLNELKKYDIDIEKISSLLNLNILSKNTNKDEIVLNLKTIQSIRDIIDDSFSDETIKEQIKIKYEEILNIVNFEYKLINNMLRNDLKNYCNNFIIKVKLFKIAECKEQIEKLQEYASLFNSNSVIKPFKSNKMMNDFFEIIKEGNFEKSEIIEIFDMFIRYNFSKYYQSKSIINQVIENNKSVVYDDLKIKTQEKEIEEEIKEEIIELTEEEKQIFDKIKKIIDIYSDEIDKDDIIFLTDDTNLLYEDDEIYMNGDKIDWSILILYIQNILIPNLNTKKVFVIEKFKKILEKYSKVEKEIQESNILKQEMIDLCNKMDICFAHFADIINYFYELADNQRNYYLTIIKMMEENQDKKIILDNINSVSKTLDWFEKLKYSLDLIAYKELLEESLENNNISNENKESLKTLIDNGKKYLEEFKLISFNNVEQAINEQNEELSEDILDFENISDAQNLVLFSIDDDINLYDDDMKLKFKNCLEKLYLNSWAELRKKNPSHMIAKIRYTLPNGYQKNYNTKYEPFRIKVKKIDQVRTGIIKISVHKNNAEKIKNRYNLKCDCNSIFIIIGVIKLEGDHFNYKEFNNIIAKKEKELEYLARLFENPKSDENELFRIIDEGREIQLKSLEKIGGE